MRPRPDSTSATTSPGRKQLECSPQMVFTGLKLRAIAGLRPITGNRLEHARIFVHHSPLIPDCFGAAAVSSLSAGPCQVRTKSESASISISASSRANVSEWSYLPRLGTPESRKLPAGVRLTLNDL